MRSYARFDSEYTIASVQSQPDAVLAAEAALSGGRLGRDLGLGPIAIEVTGRDARPDSQRHAC